MFSGLVEEYDMGYKKIRSEQSVYESVKSIEHPFVTFLFLFLLGRIFDGTQSSCKSTHQAKIAVAFFQFRAWFIFSLNIGF